MWESCWIARNRFVFSQPGANLGILRNGAMDFVKSYREHRATDRAACVILFPPKHVDGDLSLGAVQAKHSSGFAGALVEEAHSYVSID